MTWNVRNKNLVSQHVEVALVYKDMLGLDEALRYLEQAGIAPDIIERVLFTGEARAGADGARPDSARHVRCRRKNHVHDAIVEAALKIERKFGTQRALDLLKYEQVPDAVAARFAAQGPRQLRSRRTA